MFRKNKKILILFFVIAAVVVAAWFLNQRIETKKTPLNDVVIIYTNDIHTYIKNRNPEDAKKAMNLSYSALSALKEDIAAQGKEVILADAGDHIQGTAYGDMDKGATIIQMMNETGYDIATIGNHEFDYGIARILELINKAEFSYLSCNFYETDDGKLVLPAYKIIEKGGLKIAFIGISTPESITKSTPTFFMDKNGNLLYNFYSGEDGSELYNAVQKTIDEVKPQADYVIALGHLGVDLSSVPYTSREVIQHTHGLDAFIDGHSHTLIEHEYVPDSKGNEVLLTQTGAYFKGIGVMTIAKDGTISTEVLHEYGRQNEFVTETELGWIKTIDEKLGEKIAVLDSKMFVMDPKNPAQRIVRCQETNLGDLTADSYYYFFNEKLKLNCDIAFSNGGGIRNGINPGDVSYFSAKTVHPFGNQLCVVEATGQQILDALEKGAMFAGVYDETKHIPAESGGFLHVAGIKYEIDSTVESTVQMDGSGIWLGAPTGKYKVQNVQVYNRETSEFEPLDLERKYRLAGANYVLKNLGDGMAMFKGIVPILDFVGEDYIILSDYFKSFKKGKDGYPHISTGNSPLKSYKNYLLDYENPFGSGRIEINK
ncbi:bifunctional metallophosphatase/5'-nucleotidase [bacterium]|nr:bifunctional metallophosphatase/5'-nucleotidase [bacterium]